MFKGFADGDKNKVIEDSDVEHLMGDCKSQCNDKAKSFNWLPILTDQSSSIGSMQYSAPTLLEALDLARATIRDTPEQISFRDEVKFTNVKKNQENETVDSTTLLSHWLEVEVRKLPLNVIVLRGRGRNRTGPLPQYPPKRVRHSSCTTKKRSSQSMDPGQTESLMYVRRIVPKKPRRILFTLDAKTLETIQDERETRRAAFEEFATTLNPPIEKERKCSQRCVSKRGCALSAKTDTHTEATDSAVKIDLDQKQKTIPKKIPIQKKRIR